MTQDRHAIVILLVYERIRASLVKLITENGHIIYSCIICL